MNNEEPNKTEELDQELEKLLSEDGGSKRPKRRGKLKKRLFTAAAVLVVAAFVASRLMSGGKEQAPMVAVLSPAVKLIQNRLAVSGPVTGTDSVDVVSNLHAEVLEIPVKEGDMVEKGQVLAILDDTDLKKEVEIAKNNYDLAVSTCAERDKEARNGYAKAAQDLNTAQANYDRTKILFDGGSIPLVDLENAQNALNDAKRARDSYTIRNGRAVADDSYRLQIEKAKFDYDKAQERLGDTQIVAPISGTVVRVYTKIGRFADKMDDDNKPMFEIENLDELEMEINISEYSIGKVEVGQEAEISADILNGETIRGRVVSISPTGEEKAGGSTERVIPTTIRILDKNTRLIAGITARAEIILEEAEDALTVPISALFEDSGVTYVQTVREGLIHWVPVEIGIEGDIEVQVTAAEGETLDETSQVLGAPNLMYAEGMAVTVLGQ
ncbi:MAG: efflux RND transporter periplasmic adaptor subunit [Lachnospiraceae bacterium]|jgi:HlyD family secretion protein|nr:efflux RND transporter periplasmic adaptor subunit [Lachnospiraceae bacterium]